ncbi:MAG: hypothetical protein ACRDRS_14605 [Pseudonocardiaceae bacterium]
MDRNTHHHVTQALDALEATGAHPPQSLSPDELVVALSDLAAIAGLLGQLAAQTRRQLAVWTTVGTHLQQAERYAENLNRALNRACATAACTTLPPTAA